MKKYKAELTVSDGREGEVKGEKCLVKECIVQFPVACSLFQVGKNIELRIAKNKYYNFKMKAPMKGMRFNADVEEIKNNKLTLK